MKPTIIIAGGTGYLGQVLANSHLKENYRFVILTRSLNAWKSSENIRYMQWDAKNQGNWSSEINGSYAVINLAGRTVNCRYTRKNKDLIINSRVNSTHAIGLAIQNSNNPPKVWINSSSATIYRHSEDKLMTENHGELGTDFSPQVCKKWEAAINSYELNTTRKVIARTSMILGRTGGVFPVLRRLVTFGLGGKQGSGEQFMSWLHEHDFVNIIKYFLSENCSGIYNVTAPIPIKNKQFLKALRSSLGIKFGLPANKLMLKLGALVIGTETELILKSRNVYPERLLQENFSFRYKKAEQAIKAIVHSQQDQPKQKSFSKQSRKGEKLFV